jgi:hypothetical protein
MAIRVHRYSSAATGRCVVKPVRSACDCNAFAHATRSYRILGLILAAYVAAAVAASTEPENTRTALPPWLTYCDTALCAASAPLVVTSCSAANPDCMPARSTKIVAQVDGRPINSIMAILKPGDGSVSVVSGNGIADALSVTSFQAPYITFASERDVHVTYYDVAPVWGGTTAIRFTSTSLTSAELNTVFYRHVSYDTGTAAAALHARAQTVISTQQAMTGLDTAHTTVFFMPSEMSTVPGGEGNFASGNGTINVNYGNPPYIAASGGIMQTAIPRFAHEYTHELFNQIASSYRGDHSCLNEGIADALPYVAGFLPEPEFGPVGLRGTDFASGCGALNEVHDIGNCYFWHVKKAGMLTPEFLRRVFHPRRAYTFDSCAQNTLMTGNNMLVLFTEAAGGVNMIPVLDSMQLPHARSYEEAIRALGY